MAAPEISAAETRDPAEIAKFAALAARWWDPEGPFAALHRMNPVRLAFIREKLLAHFTPSARGRAVLSGLVGLDLGCGGGLVTAPLARLGAKMTGADAAEETVAAARAHAAQAGLDIEFAAAAAEDLAAARPGAFDFITALEIVEHVSDLGAFLRACETLLAPGGLLIVSTINRTPRARALALFAAEKILHMAPEGAHDYEKLVRPHELAAAAPRLAWEAPQGLSYDPLGRRWRLSHDLSMNYLRCAAQARAAAAR
ncbi:MAG: bifunctional 2-polyprenyl-6-hydroxyphenol methylase/3-demethylubiquinol 3-O-methyltransferase UbiG [Hyphomonadaceae bacterium]